MPCIIYVSPTIGFPLFAVRSGLFPLKREEGSRGRESWGAGGIGGGNQRKLSSKVVSFQRRCWNYIYYISNVAMLVALTLILGALILNPHIMWEKERYHKRLKVTRYHRNQKVS